MLIKIGERMKRIREREQGFTLVELLVVIVILGVIAALVIPKLSGNVDIAKQKADLQTIAQLESAAEQYKTLNGSYPTQAQLVNYLGLNAWPTPQVSGKTFNYSESTGKISY